MITIQMTQLTFSYLSLTFQPTMTADECRSEKTKWENVAHIKSGQKLTKKIIILQFLS